MRKKCLTFMAVLFAGIASITAPINAMKKSPNRIIFHFSDSNELYNLNKTKDKYLLGAALTYIQLLKLAYKTNDFNTPVILVPSEIKKEATRQAVEKICTIKKAGQRHHFISFAVEILQSKNVSTLLQSKTRAFQVINQIIREYHIVKALGCKCKVLKYVVAAGAFIATGFFLYHKIKSQDAQIKLLQENVNSLKTTIDHQKNYLMDYTEGVTEGFSKTYTDGQIDLLKEEIKQVGNNCKTYYDSYKKTADSQIKSLHEKINTLEGNLANANKKIKQEVDNCKAYSDSYKKTTEDQINHLESAIGTNIFRINALKHHLRGPRGRGVKGYNRCRQKYFSWFITDLHCEK